MISATIAGLNRAEASHTAGTGAVSGKSQVRQEPSREQQDMFCVVRGGILCLCPMEERRRGSRAWGRSGRIARCGGGEAFRRWID